MDKNKTLVITGATGGMGTSCAKLAHQFANKLILLDLNLEKLNLLKQDIDAHYSEVIIQTLDVTDSNSLASAEALLKQHGCDAVIHTVGISPLMANWEKIVDVDLIGAYKFMNIAKPTLRPGGCFLAISSMSAYLCPPNPDISHLLKQVDRQDLLSDIAKLSHNPLEHTGLAYSYAKKALQDVIKARCIEWGRDQGKRILTISPGFMATDQGNSETSALPDFDKRLQATAFNAMGLAEDIAEAALFLVSSKAKYITGTDILVDAGFVGNMQSQQ